MHGAGQTVENAFVVNVASVNKSRDNLMSTHYNTTRTSSRTINTSNLVPSIEKISFIKGPQVVSIIHEADKISQASSHLKPPSEHKY